MHPLRSSYALTVQGAGLFRVIAIIGLVVFAVSEFTVRSLVAASGNITVWTTDGEEFSGRLTALDANSLSVSSDADRTVPLERILRIEIEASVDDSPPDGGLVILANGDRLQVKPIRLVEERLVAQWEQSASWAELKIPLETIESVILNRPATRSGQLAILTALRNHQGENDLFFLANGDRATGELLSLDERGVQFDAAVGRTEIPLKSLQAIALNRDLISFPPAKGLRWIIRMADGSRLTATRVERSEKGRLEIDATFGATISLPLSAVRTLQLLGGRAKYLSDLTPVVYRFTPYLSSDWNYEKDRSVVGTPIRLRGEEFAKGIGMHSQSRLTYRLGKRYRRFQAKAGIDDEALGGGNVIMAVEVDGKRQFESPPITGQSKPVEIGLDVVDAQEMTLVVEFGPFGDILDYADWGDAVLIE